MARRGKNVWKYNDEKGLYLAATKGWMTAGSDKQRLLLWLAVPVMAAVLVVLAIVQYRWSGQVSDATRAQMQASLQSSLMGFRMDMARELGAMCLELKAAITPQG